MTTITATGNNFGAGDIRFQAFIEENYLILNSEVTFDPSNAAYQAVSQLEIYVPDLPIEKSAITGMLMFGTLDGDKNGTAIKAWIQDKNTIVVEKVTAWDDNDTVTLVFSNSFVPRNVKGSINVLPWKMITLTDIVGNISTYQTYWSYTDKWVFLAVTFSKIEQLDATTKVSFKIKDLPEIEDFDGIILDNQAVSPSVGTKMFRLEIRNNVFTVDIIYPDRSWHYAQHCGFICYVPRKLTTTEEQ
ncbi:MAG: hypothetical protein ACI3ZK_05415 [Candidatus Cryptobacteroides sp.]